MGKAINTKCDTRDMNIAFYERYDENFLFNKVLAIQFLCNGNESIKQDFTDYVSDKTPIEDFTLDWIKSLKAEIYFTVFMQFEALFSLLIAKFQRSPHQLYLTNYTSKEIKDKIGNFLNDEIELLTWGQLSNKYDFISQSIYSGLLSPTDDPTSKQFLNQNVSNINLLLTQVATRYLRDIKEYNSYKHGLRFTRAKSVEFQIPGIPALSFDETIGYMDVVKEEDTDVTVEVVTKINPEQSFYEVVLMRKILKNVKLFRLSELKERIPVGDPMSFVFNDMDKSQLKARETFKVILDV